MPEAYQSKTVRHRSNCSGETIANLAARMRLEARGTHHGNGGGNPQERRTRQLGMGGDQGRVSRAWPGTSSQQGRRIVRQQPLVIEGPTCRALFCCHPWSNAWHGPIWPHNRLSRLASQLLQSSQFSRWAPEPERQVFLQTAQTLPFLLISIPAGVLADRLSRSRLLLAT
jgi:hypothetical protein